MPGPSVRKGDLIEIRNRASSTYWSAEVINARGKDSFLVRSLDTDNIATIYRNTDNWRWLEDA